MRLADLHLPHWRMPHLAHPAGPRHHQPLYRALGGLEEKAGTVIAALIVAVLVVALIYGVTHGVGHPAYFDRFDSQFRH